MAQSTIGKPYEAETALDTFTNISGTSIYYMQKLGICFVAVNGNVNWTQGDYNVNATLPAEISPGTTVLVPCVNGNALNTPGAMRIGTDGKIAFYRSTTPTGNFCAAFAVYPVAG